MKLLAVIVLVLAHGPCLLANVLSGWYSPAPAPVYPTKTFSVAFTTLRATVQVPPTSVVVRDHNNVGEFGELPITSFYEKIFSTASTISISTASPVPSTHASTDDVAFAPKLVHHVNMLWNGVTHWLQHELGRLIEQVIVFYVYLWTFLVAALVLLRKRGLVRPNVTIQLVPSVEGLLLLFSCTESADQWSCLWVPRRKHTYYLSNGPVDRDADFNAAASGLYNILLQSVSSYHSWAPQLAGNLLVAGPTPLHTSEPTVQPKSTAGGELCSRRRPHFRPAITRLGGPSTQVASQPFVLKREFVLVDWIKIPSEEGAIILYGYSTTSNGRPTKWISQYFPRHPHTYYLSDRPANRDTLLLGILLRSTSIYHPWALGLDGVLVDIAGEIVEVIASTDSKVGVEMDTLPHTDSRPNTPDLPSVVDTPPTSVDHAKSRLDTRLEAPLTFSLDDIDKAGGFDSNMVQASSTLPLPALATRPPALNTSTVWNAINAASQASAYAFPKPEAPTSQVHRSPLGPPAGPSFQSPRVLPPFNNNTFAYQRGQQVYRPTTTSFAYGPNVSQPNTTSFGYQHTPSPYHPNNTSIGYQHTPMPYHPYATPAAYQPRPMVFLPYAYPAAYQHPTAYHQQPNHMMMPQPQTVQRVAAVRQEVRPLLPFLANRASQRQDPGFWARGSTGFREEAMAEELEPEEAPKKKFRRGGKRLTARKHRWEELERQRREGDDPDAGPSGLGQH